MTKPTKLGKWATEPGSTVEPPEDMQVGGFMPGDRPPARWHNHLFNLMYQWQKYIDKLHEETDFLNKVYAWTGAHGFAGTVGFSVGPRLSGPSVEVLYADVAGNVQPRERHVFVPIPPMAAYDFLSDGTERKAWFGAGGALFSNQPLALVEVPLPVPRDARMTGLSLLYNQGSDGGGTPARLQAVYRDNSGPHDLGSPALSTSGISVPLMPLGIDRVKTDGEAFYAQIRSSGGAGAGSNTESFGTLVVTYLDAGPRNG